MEKTVDTNSPEFRSWVKGLLHDINIKDLRVTFTKTDGTERTLTCTLAESAIPADKAPKGTGRETSDATQRVFDIEKSEWRSFRWDAVKRVEFSISTES